MQTVKNGDEFYIRGFVSVPVKEEDKKDTFRISNFAQ